MYVMIIGIVVFITKIAGIGIIRKMIKRKIKDIYVVNASLPKIKINADAIEKE